MLCDLPFDSSFRKSGRLVCAAFSRYFWAFWSSWGTAVFSKIPTSSDIINNDKFLFSKKVFSRFSRFNWFETFNWDLNENRSNNQGPFPGSPRPNCMTNSQNKILAWVQLLNQWSRIGMILFALSQKILHSNQDL